MTIKELFEMIEKANEFQVFVGELKRRIQVVFNDETITETASFEQFVNVLSETINNESVMTEILGAELTQVGRKIHRIKWIEGEEKFHIDLMIA